MVIALLGAAYVALGYYRAAEVVERRAAADALIADTVARARGWASELTALNPVGLEAIERACSDRLISGVPASLMLYIAPLSAELPAGDGLQAGDDLVGWSTWGLAWIPVDGPIRAEPYSHTVLDALGSPSRWQRAVWRRDGQNVPFINQARLLVVGRVSALRPEVRMLAAVYDLSTGVEVCRGVATARPRPRPMSNRFGPADLPPQYVSFAFNEPVAIDRAIRFTLLDRLCRVGGAGLCAQAALRR